MNHNLLEKCSNELPIHVWHPLSRILNSHNYFKKLHLISDVLIGFFRLYGHAVIKISQEETLISEALEQSIETLMTKDSHGLWSSTIVKLIQEQHKQESESLSPELATLFGVKLKSVKNQPSIEKITVRNTVIDGKGQKQLVEIINTPIELLINFRNKYVGHGTVYSESESKQIYETYEPILQVFLEGLLACKAFQFKDTETGLSLHGIYQVCSGSINLKYQSKSYTFASVEQLKVVDLTLESKSVVSYSITDEVDIKIIHNYPYFLALPYKRTLIEEDNFKRLHLLKEVFLNYLKYIGLLTASEYFNSNLKIGEINRAFKNFLYRPQFGHWNAFMRSAIQALNEHNHQWFIKELSDYYNDIETTPFATRGETSIGKLINFRNHYLGHNTVPSEQECMALWQENFGILKDLLVRLDFCKNYTIISTEKAVSWRLMGDEITQVNLRQKMKSNVAMLNTANEELGIVPFFILPGEAFTKEVSSKAKLMVYEQNTGSRIVFFSPESIQGETSNEQILEQLNLMIRDKEKQEPVAMKDLDEISWKAILIENNEATIQSLLSEKKVIKGIYQERQDAEVALRSWIGARAGLFFLAAEAGSGKTNLLVEMNRQYQERGLDTILLRGNRFRTPNIWKELCYRLNLTAESTLEDSGFVKYEQENPLIILIDGANENSNSKILFDSIIQFLDQYKGGHIKIVLSWRVNTKSELPCADEIYESIIYSDSKEGNREENIISRSCHWLKPLNKVEVEGAWNMYVRDKKDKVRRKPNFTFEDLKYEHPSLVEQLENPLLLRLFLELNNNKGMPKSRGGFLSIWNLYHERITSAYDLNLLRVIVELMLKREENILPVDLLFDDETIGDLVKSIQIDSPYQQLLIEGVLTESIQNEKLYVSFTVEGYFHFVLGEVFHSIITEKGINYLKEQIGTNKLKGFKEGAEQGLIHEVEKENFDLIFELIDLGEDFSDICVKCLVYSLLSINIKEKIDRKLYSEDDFDKKINELYIHEARIIVKEHLKKLFNDFTKEDIRVLEKINTSLSDFESKKSTLIRQVLFEELKVYSELHLTVLEFMIKGIGLNNWDNNTKLELLDSIEKKIDLLPKKNDVKFLSSIGSGYALINEYGKSEKFQKEAYNLVKDSDQKEKIRICGRLGSLYGDWAKTYKSELYDTSEEYHDQAIASAISEFGENASEVSTHRNNLAKLLLTKNMALTYKLSDSEKSSNLRKAHKLLELSRKTVERNSGLYSERMAGLYNNLAFVFRQNDTKKELEMFLKSLEIVERIFNENDPRRETLMINIGGLYRRSGNYKEAFNYFVKGYQIALFYNKKAHLSDLSSTFSELKNQLLKSGDFETLMEYCNRILKIKKDHINAIETLGDCYAAMGEHHKAYDQFKHIYDKFKLDNSFLEKLIETAVKIECISEALTYYVYGMKILKDKEFFVHSDEFKSKNKGSNSNSMPDITRRMDPKKYQERIKTEFNQLRKSCLALAEKHNKLNELPDWILNEK